MDRSTGTPLGFAILLLFALGFAFVGLQGGHGDHTESRLVANYAQPQCPQALVWPGGMPGPITEYVGCAVNGFGLTVTSVDADEGFWVVSGERRAWVQLETAVESPFTVRPGDVITFSGRVLPHDPDFPNGLYFCPDRDASAARLAGEPTHFAVRVDALSFGVG
jgi:hypothetical protein